MPFERPDSGIATVQVVVLRSGDMVPIINDPDPCYDRLLVDPELAPRFIAEPLTHLMKWQSREHQKLDWFDQRRIDLEEAIAATVKALDVPSKLQEGPTPVVRIVSEPEPRECLAMELGMDLADGFRVIKEWESTTMVLRISTMRRDDPRIQSRTSGGH